ncbi:MAG TPA: hypothetical protein VGK45_18260, partial [Thermoanaerobaculia bacterium]
LHLGLGGNPEQADLPAEEAQALSALARAAGYENLLRLLHQLLASEQVVRRSDTGALALEIAWLRAAELPKLSRVEELLAGLPATATTAPNPMNAPPQRVERAPAPAAPRSAAEPPPAQRPAPAPPPAARPAAPVAPPPPAGDPVQAFLEAVSLRKAPFAALLSEADITLSEGELRIAVPAEDSLLESRLQQAVYRQVVEEAIAAVCGPGITWRTVRAAPKPKPEAAVASGGPGGAGGAAAERVAENPQVQAVLDIFGGKVETVEEHGSFREDQP